MELLNEIASWVGWPAVSLILFAIGVVGMFIYEKHISVLKNHLDFEKSKNQELQNYRPDVIADRFAKRHKVLTELLEESNNEIKEDQVRISSLEIELEEIKKNASLLKHQLDYAQEILSDFVQPREGKVKPEIVNDILKTVSTRKEIYFPVSISCCESADLAEKLKSGSPFRLAVDFPGMFKQYLVIFDNENNQIGLIDNPYIETYNKDYYESLMSVLRPYIDQTEHQTTVLPFGSHELLNSEFHCFSPIDDSVVYIKLPYITDASEKSVAG